MAKVIKVKMDDKKKTATPVYGKGKSKASKKVSRKPSPVALPAQMTTPFEAGMQPQMTTPFEASLPPQMTTPYSAMDLSTTNVAQQTDLLEMAKQKLIGQATMGPTSVTQNGTTTIEPKKKSKAKTKVKKAPKRKPNFTEMIDMIEAGEGQQFIKGSKY